VPRSLPRSFGRSLVLPPSRTTEDRHSPRQRRALGAPVELVFTSRDATRNWRRPYAREMQLLASLMRSVFNPGKRITEPVWRSSFLRVSPIPDREFLPADNPRGDLNCATFLPYLFSINRPFFSLARERANSIAVKRNSSFGACGFRAGSE